MKVTNINGTSKHKCKCDSWIKHWEKFSKQTADKCSVKGCSSAATDGAHVQKSGGTNSWYIVPFCHTHNTSPKNTVLELKDDSKQFVSANVSETCGKN